MNKNLIIFLGTTCAAALLYFFVNMYIPISFNYICPIDGKEYQTTLAVYSAVIFMLCLMYVIVQYIVFDMAEQKTLKAYKKEYEKNSISEAEKDSKIQALENKVKTLETALDNVLKNKD